jgi:hypothetical protein
LLECRVGNIVGYLNQFGESGRQQYPRSVEEAILLLKLISPADIDIKNHNIHTRTVQRFWRFNVTLNRYKANRAEAKASLRSEFGDTYWYYAFFMNPERTKQRLKKSKVNEELY